MLKTRPDEKLQMTRAEAAFRGGSDPKAGGGDSEQGASLRGQPVAVHARCLAAVPGLQTPRGGVRGSGRSPRAPLQNETAPALQSPGLLPAERSRLICCTVINGTLASEQLRRGAVQTFVLLSSVNRRLGDVSSDILIRVTSRAAGQRGCGL